MTHYLTLLSRWIDRLNRTIGRSAAWLALAMVLVQFIVVVMRYVFGIGSIMMQEAIIYMHAVLFMMAAADTLLQDEHVRVDIFMPPPRRIGRRSSIFWAARFWSCRFASCWPITPMTMWQSHGRCAKVARDQRHSRHLSSEIGHLGFCRAIITAGRFRHYQNALFLTGKEAAHG